MKIRCESRGIFPRILNLGTRWDWSASRPGRLTPTVTAPVSTGFKKGSNRNGAFVNVPHVWGHDSNPSLGMEISEHLLLLSRDTRDFTTGSSVIQGDLLHT